MILSSVSETLASVGHQSSLESSISELRQGTARERLAGLTETGKALVAAIVATELRRPMVILVESGSRAEEFAASMQFFYKALAGQEATEVTVLPALDVLPWQEAAPHAEILETRAVTLWRFATGEARVVVAPIAAARMRLADAAYYAEQARTLAREDPLSLDDLVAHLRRVGYESHDMVEMPGQFTVRGGIVDIFPAEAERPVRLELFGDTVESLREFDPNTQRSVRPIDRVTLPPLVEQSGNGFGGGYGNAEGSPKSSHAHSLLDLHEDTVVLLDEPGAIEEASRAFLQGAMEDLEAKKSESLDLLSSHYFTDDWDELLARHARLELEQLALTREDSETRVIQTQPTSNFHGNVPAFMEEARKRVAAGERVLLAAESLGELERYVDLCHEYEVPFRLGDLEENATSARLAEDSSAGSIPAVVLCRAPFTDGVVFLDARVTIFGTGDVFESMRAGAAKRRPKTASFFSDFSELKAGDYVVHVDHGIGQFEGLHQIENGGARGEFMRLRYADDARLYVPLERLDLVQSYRAVEGATPVLDKLGGSTWTARKARVKKSVEDMAEKLLKIYAGRKSGDGFAFSPEGEFQREFEDAFEFEETPDQAIAIADVKRDMERQQPMDRLLCGDVGYGKTEVAMRAAFKAATDSKQVAVLAPTTILAFQHYETFRKRFAAFPIKVDLLSRFRTAREQKETLARVETGEVDIVIGTHRLLSKDVKFHDLGLLVVDEEQRFGVAHKERLKELKLNVDVLTLSATPIPRTLNMSLVGLRDMSVIETPPKDRMAIQTVVAPFSESLIRRAIDEEMLRHGQVFLVHNRVETIYAIADLVKKLVPKSRVVVGHGQMSEKELEAVMFKFVRGEADVLVSTTIVENGLDIPAANTILINRADRFGLSELYQLRGRVGRSNQRAYAYLLVPEDVVLTQLATRRLAALKEFSALGAGFRVAALDLELRGAGNLLGGQQHGHINAIGFDMYVQMLERAVSTLKGEEVKPEMRATINLGLDIRIPEEYVPNENLRLRTYKRIAGITNEKERDEVNSELTDRFGSPPSAVGNLLDYALLKGLAERMLISSIERRANEVAIKFHPETPLSPENLVKFIRSQKEGLRLDPSGTLWMRLDRRGRVAESVRNVLLPLELKR
ncbi:MAG TPA: transcription-repair coupling factor [Candidatus Saccharimonadales bacterium]|jgi:transcription-repair coupling factor (superfamily II helicase)|nr:transcription-repair coupling factor [Candidatus Saccharimonadales bacterium]